MSFDQEVVRILRQVPGQRLVLLTRQEEKLLTTRFFLHPVKLALGGLVDQVTVTGEGSVGGLPESLALALEGYRVRAGLGRVAGLPEVVTAGVTADVEAFLPAPGPGLGYAYVSTHFIAGESLAQVGDQLATGEKLALLRRLLRLVGRLHERLVVYGDLKPHNVIAVGDQPWLIDLDTMRRVPRADLAIPTRDLTPSYAAPEQTEEQLTYLASDVYSFARLGRWLLEAERTSSPDDPAIAPWDALFARALAESPADRPGARSLLDEAGLSSQANDDEDVSSTVPVLDLLDEGGAQEEAYEGTVQAWQGVFAGGSAGLSPGPSRAGAEPAGGGEAALPGEQAQPREIPRADNAPMVFRTRTPPDARYGSEPAAAERDEDFEPSPASARHARARTEQVAPRPRPALLVFAGLAIAIAALFAFFILAPAARSGGALPPQGAGADASPPADAGPPPFRHCDEGATRVVLTRLGPDDALPPPSEILAWFSSLSPDEVEVHRFRHGERDDRYVSFELSRDGWSEWPDIAEGASGEELCTRLGEELAKRDLGPPDSPRAGEPHEFRFLARRSERVRDLELVGDLRGVANGDTYAAMLDWLEPLEVEVSHCRARGGWLRDDALEIDCSVRNPREQTAALHVVAAMVPEHLEQVERDRRVVLEAGESTEIRFDFDEYEGREDTYCDCSASTLP